MKIGEKSALVCGAGGFIGNHLVSALRAKNFWVRGVDLNYPEFSSSEANEFLLLDLRKETDCNEALTLQSSGHDKK